MKIVIYGVLDKNDNHLDTSKTLKGAKRYATLNGYTKVSKRTGYIVTLVSEKINELWKDVKKS